MTNTSESPVLADCQKLVAGLREKISFVSIDLEQLIYLRDFPELSSGNDTEPFETLLPPIVTPAQNNQYEILDGYKRISAMRRNHNETHCICGVVESFEKQTHAGLLRILLNGARVLEFREKLLFARWLKCNLDATYYLEITASLGLTARDRYELELLFEVNDLLVDAVAQGRLSSAAAVDIAALSHDDQEALLKFFAQFSFSRQMQRELIEWLPEIAFRNHRSIQLIISDSSIEALCSNAKINEPQKIQKIREMIYLLRFPSYSATLESWRKTAKQANPDPSRITLTPSEFFEKDHLEIKISVSRGDDIEPIMQKLQQVPLDIWQKLLSPHSTHRENDKPKVFGTNLAQKSF